MTNRGNTMRHRTAAQLAHIRAMALQSWRVRRALKARKNKQPEPFGRAISATAIMAPLIKTVDPQIRALIDAAVAAKRSPIVPTTNQENQACQV